MGFSFVRRCVSSPEIIPIKPRRTVAVPGSVSIARGAMHRHSKAHADPLCPKEEGTTNTHSVHRLARNCVLRRTRYRCGSGDRGKRHSVPQAEDVPHLAQTLPRVRHSGSAQFFAKMLLPRHRSGYSVPERTERAVRRGQDPDRRGFRCVGGCPALAILLFTSGLEPRCLPQPPQATPPPVPLRTV